MAGIDETTKKMGLDYLDMMIIHSPQPWVKVNQSEDRYVNGNREAWKALEDAYKAGKLKAIGLSNFQIGDIENILEVCEIKPRIMTMNVVSISKGKNVNKEIFKNSIDGITKIEELCTSGLT